MATTIVLPKLALPKVASLDETHEETAVKLLASLSSTSTPERDLKTEASIKDTCEELLSLSYSADALSKETVGCPLSSLLNDDSKETQAFFKNSRLLPQKRMNMNSFHCSGVPRAIKPSSFLGCVKASLPLPPSSCGGILRVSKKRERICIKPSQLKLLEEFFQKNPNPDRDYREKISTETGMSTRRVQVWFQNKRARVRKDREGSSTPEETNEEQYSEKQNLQKKSTSTPQVIPRHLMEALPLALSSSQLASVHQGVVGNNSPKPQKPSANKESFDKSSNNNSSVIRKRKEMDSSFAQEYLLSRQQNKRTHFMNSPLYMTPNHFPQNFPFNTNFQANPNYRCLA